MEAVPYREGEGDGSQYRQHHQEERPERVDDKGGSCEHQLQQFAEPVTHALLDVVRRTVHVHARHGDHVRRRPAQLVYLTVELLVRGEIGGFRVAHHRLVFQPVFLFPVLLHVKGLFLQYRVRPLYDYSQNGVHRSQHDGREEEDAQSDGKRPQQRVHVYRLGTGKRLPHAHRHIEQGAQSGKPLCHSCHVRAKRHHLLIQREEYLVQVVKLSHRLPVFFVGVPVECHHPVHVVFLSRPQVRHRYGLVRVVAHEVAVVHQAAVGIVYDGEPFRIRQ